MIRSFLPPAFLISLAVLSNASLAATECEQELSGKVAASAISAEGHFLTTNGAPQPFPRDAQSRVWELSREKDQCNRQGIPFDPYKEGELRALVVFPDRSLAAVLLQREYLASVGMGQLSVVDQERLRLHRVDELLWQRQNQKGFLLEDSPLHRVSQSRLSPQERAAIIESNRAKMRAAEFQVRQVQAMLSATRAQREGAAQCDPTDAPRCALQALTLFLGSTPDHLPFYRSVQAAADRVGPGLRLEQYFLSLVPGFVLEHDLPTPGALSVVGSLGCLRDAVRTKIFLLAMEESIKSIEFQRNKHNSASHIEVLDAGTGSIPILAIYAALLSKRVRVTALELNEESARLAQQMVRALGLQHQIDVIQADAIQVETPRRYDLIVSETMNSGLLDEPIVQIFSNLKRFLRAGGIVLPSEVRVLAAPVPMSKWLLPESQVQLDGVGFPVVEANWVEVARYRPGEPLHEIDFQVQVAFPQEGLLLATEVFVGEQKLEVFDSAITMPLAVPLPQGDALQASHLRSPRLRQPLRVRYKPGAKREEIRVEPVL